VALAEELASGARATGASVAGRMGLTTHQASQFRERLITKGTVVAEGERLGFVVPGLGEYILRRATGESLGSLMDASSPPLGPLGRSW
jgi:hypothetical protein